jgi:hypothetical protein
MADVRGGAGAVTGTVLVDTNVFTARLRERSPLATRYAKHLFGQRIALGEHLIQAPGSRSQAPGAHSSVRRRAPRIRLVAVWLSHTVAPMSSEARKLRGSVRVVAGGAASARAQRRAASGCVELLTTRSLPLSMDVERNACSRRDRGCKASGVCRQTLRVRKSTWSATMLSAWVRRAQREGCGVHATYSSSVPCGVPS